MPRRRAAARPAPAALRRHPEWPVEPDSVYALELGTPTSRGYVGLEDEALVGAEGARFISGAQTELICVG